MEKHRPLKVLRTGRLRAAIWKRNEGEPFPGYSVSFSRVAKDREGKFRDSHYYFQKDMLNLITLVTQVHTFILEQSAKPVGPDAEQ